MPRRYYLINTPEFSEYVFHVMSTAPKEVLTKLSTREMMYFKDKRAMRRFSDFETAEKRLQLLAKIEIPFCIVVGKREPTNMILDEIATQYKYVGKRKTMIEAMSREKVFVLSSNDVLVSLHMAAQNSHSRVYILNHDYVKLQQQMADAGVASKNQDMRDAESAFEMMARAMLTTLIKFDHSRALSDVDPYEMKILLALLEHRNTFVSVDKISEILDEGKRTQGITKTCTIMLKSGLLRSIPQKGIGNHKIQAYTIAERGINAVMQFVKHVSTKAYYGM